MVDRQCSTLSSVINYLPLTIDHMQITINNESYNFEENTSLETAIDALQLEETKGIALALNEEIIPRSQWSETILTNEDKIIIIGAVAGG